MTMGLSLFITIDSLLTNFSIFCGLRAIFEKTLHVFRTGYTKFYTEATRYQEVYP